MLYRALALYGSFGKTFCVKWWGTFLMTVVAKWIFGGQKSDYTILFSAFY